MGADNSRSRGSPANPLEPKACTSADGSVAGGLTAAAEETAASEAADARSTAIRAEEPRRGRIRTGATLRPPRARAHHRTPTSNDAPTATALIARRSKIFSVSPQPVIGSPGGTGASAGRNEICTSETIPPIAVVRCSPMPTWSIAPKIGTSRSAERPDWGWVGRSRQGATAVIADCGGGQPLPSEGLWQVPAKNSMLSLPQQRWLDRSLRQTLARWTLDR